jgi:stage II sporulation protein D
MLNYCRTHYLMKFVILGFSALVTTNCVRYQIIEKPVSSPETITPERILIQTSATQGTVLSLPLEEYVLGSVLAESDFSELDATETLRLAQIQAILARTYAVANIGRHAKEGFDLCATTHCQVYRPINDLPDNLKHSASEAVNKTSGLLITYNGQPINAVFHADCGGYTSNADAVWEGGASPPYLRGAPDVLCLWRGITPWRFEIDSEDLRKLLNLKNKTRIGSRLDEIIIKRLDEAGRVQNIMIEGEHSFEMRGTTLRSTLAAELGPLSIRSTRFSVLQEEKTFVFEGQGFGHGVGLCQAGAKARINAGHSSLSVFQHYYPGTVLQNSTAR